MSALSRMPIEEAAKLLKKESEVPSDVGVAGDPMEKALALSLQILNSVREEQVAAGMGADHDQLQELVQLEAMTYMLIESLRDYLGEYRE